MTAAPIKLHPRANASPLARRLKRETQGEVLFDAYSRGRYSTDASIYQIEPVGGILMVLPFVWLTAALVPAILPRATRQPQARVARGAFATSAP